MGRLVGSREGDFIHTNKNSLKGILNNTSQLPVTELNLYI